VKRLITKYGKLITASFFIMAIGIIAFLLTPVLYSRWGIDSDLPGLMIAFTGVALLIIGMIRRNKPHGWKLAVLIIIAVLLLLPLVPLVVSLVYYLITGKALGS
jgi:hypothetical protein